MYSADFDPDEWCLPPLDVEALPSEPPPFHGQPTAGVFLGSELSAVRFTRDAEFVDLGEAVVEGFAGVQPGLVELARLGSTDFGALSRHWAGGCADRVGAAAGLVGRGAAATARRGGAPRFG